MSRHGPLPARPTLPQLQALPGCQPLTALHATNPEWLRHRIINGFHNDALTDRASPSEVCRAQGPQDVIPGSGRDAAGRAVRSVSRVSAVGVSTWIRAYVNPALVSLAAFGDDVYPATAGGYVVAGPTGVSPYNAWIGKVAAPGQLQWQKKVGCGASNVLSVQQTSDGGYILAGGSNGCAGQCASGGLSYLAGAWVLKLSPAGAVDWQNVYPAALQSSATQVRQTSDGGYVVAGSTQDSSGTNYAWIAKLSSQGAVQWQRQIGASTFADAQTVQQTSDDGYIIAGSTGSIGSSSVLVVKLDASGTIQWQQTSSTGSDYEDTASSVPQTAGDGYVVAGQVIPQIPPGIRLPDALLLKLTSGGTIQWQDRYDAGDSLSSSVLRTADGGYAIAGSIQLIVDGEPETASWLAKTTFTGTISWQHDYYAINASTTRPYPRAFSGLAQAGDGGFVAARYTDGYRNSDNVWLVKTDATGNVASCAEARPATSAAVGAGLTASGSSLPVAAPATAGAGVSGGTATTATLTTHKDC